MVFNKKAISPVVATALLLVVAVVAVVGFQTWFNTYQSGLNVKVEQQSNSGSAITIDRLEVANSGGNATIYLRNRDTATNIDLISWKVSTSTGSTVCSNATLQTGAIIKNTVTSFTTVGAGCSPVISVDTSYGVSVVTNSGVFSAKLIAR